MSVYMIEKLMFVFDLIYKNKKIINLIYKRRLIYLF